MPGRRCSNRVILRMMPPVSSCSSLSSSPLLNVEKCAVGDRTASAKTESRETAEGGCERNVKVQVAKGLEGNCGC
eukprot:3723950-Rhodomonas_salina.1